MAFYVVDALPLRPPLVIAHHDGLFQALSTVAITIKGFFICRGIVTKSRIAAWRDKAQVAKAMNIVPHFVCAMGIGLREVVLN